MCSTFFHCGNLQKASDLLGDDAWEIFPLKLPHTIFILQSISAHRRLEISHK